MIGVVLIPEKNQLWISNGRKSWCESRDGTYLKTNLSQNKRRIDDMTIVTSKNHRNQTLKKVIEKLNFKDQIVMGSIGCKIASILGGESNIYICLSLPGKSSPKDWDFAKGVISKNYDGSLTSLNNHKLAFIGSNLEQGGIIAARSDMFSHVYIRRNNANYKKIRFISFLLIKRCYGCWSWFWIGHPIILTNTSKG